MRCCLPCCCTAKSSNPEDAFQNWTVNFLEHSCTRPIGRKKGLCKLEVCVCTCIRTHFWAFVHDCSIPKVHSNPLIFCVLCSSFKPFYLSSDPRSLQIILIVQYLTIFAGFDLPRILFALSLILSRSSRASPRVQWHELSVLRSRLRLSWRQFCPGLFWHACVLLWRDSGNLGKWFEGRSSAHQS